MMKSPEFKVGVFVAVCILIIIGLSLRVNNDPSNIGSSQKFDVLLPNASGLVKNSNVKMAGIPIGIIKDILLEDGKARVVMVLRGNIPFTKSASVEIKANGILGDKYLEIFPGNPADEALPSGGRIEKFADKGSFDSILNQVGQLTQDASDVAKALKKATTGEGDEDSPLGRIVLNIEDITTDLREMIQEKRGNLEKIVDNIHSVSKSLNEFINDESDNGFKTNWKKMAQSLGRVDSILKNVDDITGKINKGEGTLGKLVNDETTVEDLNQAISGVNNLLNAANKMQFNVDYHSEVMAHSFIKSYVGLTIQPGPDRYYLLQLVDDPKGSVERVSVRQEVNGGAPDSTNTQTVHKNKFKFSAQFAKNFYDVTLRAGLFESTGGAGFDYFLLKRNLRFSVEAFDFGREEGVDVRLYARYKFLGVFYAIAGGDDILNTRGNPNTGTGASGFIGAGLDFTNDDLRLLLARVSF